MHPLAVAAAVAGLGIPIATPGMTPSMHIPLSEPVYHPFHGKQYRQYRRACYRLASMARSIQEAAEVMGPLGTPVKATCAIALSVVRALEVSSEPFIRTTSHWSP